MNRWRSLLEGARAQLVRSVRQPNKTADAVDAEGHDLVDGLVAALLMCRIGALSAATEKDLLSGERTLEALRVVSKFWWVWRGVDETIGWKFADEAVGSVALAAASWIDSFDGSAAEVLFACHEGRLAGNEGDRKNKGAFYTPMPVALALVKAGLDATDASHGRPPRILDPACGAGVFLVAAFRTLAGEVLESPVDGSLARRLALAKASLHGIDLDARAVDVAKRAVIISIIDDPAVQEELALALTFPETSALAQAVSGIHVGDSLLGADAPPEARLPGVPVVDWPTVFTSAMAAGGFDLVVGNPPFASFAGREARSIDPVVRAYLTTRHHSLRWPALHSWFVASAVRSLSRDVVAFVLPEQVFHLDGYADLRALAAERFTVVQARRLDEKTFADAATPSGTIVLKRFAETVMGALTAPDHKPPLPALWLAPERPPSVDRMIARGGSLRAWLSDVGIRTTNRKEQVRVIAPSPVDDQKEWVPALEGKDIGAWRTNAPRIEVCLGGGAIVRPKSRYEVVSYVIRQTAAYPICAQRVGVVYFRNSLLALTAPEGAPCDVRYVAAVLNSRLGRYLYAVLVQESAQRVFPQVKVGALARIPIRFPEGEDEWALHQQIVGLVDARLLKKAGSKAARSLDAALDAAVETLHGVDEALRPIIVERLRGLPPPP